MSSQGLNDLTALQSRQPWGRHSARLAALSSKRLNDSLSDTASKRLHLMNPTSLLPGGFGKHPTALVSRTCSSSLH